MRSLKIAAAAAEVAPLSALPAAAQVDGGVSAATPPVLLKAAAVLNVRTGA